MSHTVSKAECSECFSAILREYWNDWLQQITNVLSK